MATARVQSGYIDGYYDEDNDKIGTEVYGRDVIYLNADEIIPKTELLTDAKDIAGAINELFQADSEGGDDDDEWQLPSDWLDIPEPESNQLIIYVEPTATAIACGIVLTSGNGTIDWGDGWVDTLSNDTTYTDGTRRGHVYSAGKYVITVTNTGDDNSIWIDNATVDQYSYAGQNISSSQSVTTKFIKAVKVGSATYAGGCANADGYLHIMITGNAFNSLQYIKFCGEVENVQLSGIHSLKRVDFAVPPTSIYDINSCNCLQTIDLSAVTTVTNNCSNLYSLKKISMSVTEMPTFQSCYALKEVDLPNVTSIPARAFTYCYNLERVYAPNCTEIIGSDSSTDDPFYFCCSLREVIVAEGCTCTGTVLSNAYQCSGLTTVSTDNA